MCAFPSFVCDYCADVCLECEWRRILIVELVNFGFECEFCSWFKGVVVFV